MMNRRGFIISSSLLTITTFLSAHTDKISFETNQWKTIENIYKVIFPNNKKYGLEHYNPARYLFISSRSRYFPKKDLEFILNGAKWIKEDDINIKNMEELLNTSWGENWLSYLLNYALEGLYSDPIYGGNHNKIGWQMINHTTGIPRPKKQYGKKL